MPNWFIWIGHKDILDLIPRLECAINITWANLGGKEGHVFQIQVCQEIVPHHPIANCNPNGSIAVALPQVDAMNSPMSRLDRLISILAHEVCHVWQFKQGLDVPGHSEKVYKDCPFEQEAFETSVHLIKLLYPHSHGEQFGMREPIRIPERTKFTFPAGSHSTWWRLNGISEEEIIEALGSANA